MCGMLLQEFFDGTPLQKQLVAAYVPGVKFQDDKFKFLKKMDEPLATSGYVSWNTYKSKNYPQLMKNGTKEQQRVIPLLGIIKQ